jgi:RNA polymerase sigma-70 factor (ECF subfamily)
MSDNELLQLAIQGDEEAFTKLVEASVEKVRPAIFGAFNPLNPDDFKDALQTAMDKAWRKMSTFRGESEFSTWFYIILKHELLNLLKVRSAIKKHEIPMVELFKLDPQEKEDDAARFHDTLDRAVTETAQTILEKQDDMEEYRKLITMVLEKLSPAHSQVIKLVLEDGKSYREVSDELNISIGTVMSRLYYAREHAQELIKQYAKRNNIQLSGLGR